GFAADQFMIGRALGHAVGQSEQVVRIYTLRTQVISADSCAIRWLRISRRRTETRIGIENYLSVYVKVQQLIEFLIANIATKFQTVVADDLAVIVAELKRVADLRQLAAKVVSDGKSTVQLDKRQTALVGRQTVVHTEIGISRATGRGTGGRCTAGEAISACIPQRNIRGSGKAERSDRSRAARIGDCTGACRSVELHLAFTEIAEAKLIH